MKARELMTPNPAVVTTTDTLSTAARVMRDRDVGVVPVVEDGDSGRLRGLITDRDIAVRHIAEGHTEDCRVIDHMSESITAASPDDDADEVMAQMQREQVRRIPVVDDGRLVGIIAQADVAIRIGPDDPEDVEETVTAISRPGR